MLRLVMHMATRPMRAYVTLQPRVILHGEPAIRVNYLFVSKPFFSNFSNSHTQKQAQVESTFPTKDLTSEIPGAENINSRLLVENIFRGADSREQGDASTTAIPQILPVAKPCNRNLYWQKIGLWKDVSEETFQGSKWQRANIIRSKPKLLRFLMSALPETIPSKPGSSFEHIKTREDFIKDVFEGMEIAPMTISLTPHILSVIDWNNPLEDPVRRQFIPMKSSAMPDHPKLTLDSLGEQNQSPVMGLVHRYGDRALFLATSICPVYCRFCTRSYAVGLDTSTVMKKALKPNKIRWDDMFAYIEKTPSLNDIVISGGDSYLLEPYQILEIGKRLISIEHIRRFRFASKGPAAWPSRIVDSTDSWADALIEVSKLGRRAGKEVALHTHFNHPNEISWITSLAAARLFTEGVKVRNQSVLLRGVNDDLPTMSSLIRGLADINIQPYYVYQGDMVKGVEDLRTPLQTSLDLEQHLRGSIAGFMMPQFVVDLPGGGGKRLAASYRAYDRESGESIYEAPAVEKGKQYTYYDPEWSLTRGMN